MFGRNGEEVAIGATSDATVLVLNGQPIDEPIFGYGPFVMNTPQQIQQAIADMRRPAGKDSCFANVR
ncbi:MAG: pirin-like C-terminal cupin domain-containing protein [Chromatiales bacterium]